MDLYKIICTVDDQSWQSFRESPQGHIRELYLSEADAQKAASRMGWDVDAEGNPYQLPVDYRVEQATVANLYHPYGLVRLCQACGAELRDNIPWPEIPCQDLTLDDFRHDPGCEWPSLGRLPFPGDDEGPIDTGA
jgi:hypothetical protein